MKLYNFKSINVLKLFPHILKALIIPPKTFERSQIYRKSGGGEQYNGYHMSFFWTH
jgi:hypothetical protein